MKRVFLPALSCAAALAAGAPPDLGLYRAILQEHVLGNGTVRYAALHAGLEPLDRFVQQIAAVSPDSHPTLFPSREHRLVYWLNTYNALVLWAFAKDYPDNKDRLRGAVGRALFFYRTKFTVGGRQRSLDDIETNSIRKPFAEPRIHFAIVCASTGCPWLAREPFTAEMLDRQLEKRTRLFLSQERNLRVDPAGRALTVSKIFDWFAKDFGGSADAVVRFIGRYRPEVARGAWKFRYLEYDWTLNDAGPR